MIKIKQHSSIALIKLFSFFLLCSCTYEPETIIKIPRNKENSVHSVVKKPNHITSAHKSTLNIQLDKNKKQPPQLPLIEINLSNFKSNLLGLSKPEIIELLDKPNFKRTEHPASIWQYQSRVCFVDIFFYSIKQMMVVDHIETRSIGLKRVNEKICFSSLIDSRYATRSQNQGVQ